jgi:hypothetical protein
VDTGVSTAADRWSAELYLKYTAPMRPSPEDVQVIAEAADRQSGGGTRPLRVLLLGVTPDIVHIKWPRGSFLLAVDHSPSMINGLWPGDVPGVRQVVCGDWLDGLELGEPFDLVVGDGVPNLLSYPDGLHKLMRRLDATLAALGVVILRAFVLPDRTETAGEVLDAMWKGAIGQFTELELRLLMASQESIGQGVTAARAHDCWLEHSAGTGRGLCLPEWRARAIETLGRWRGLDFSMTFPTTAALTTAVRAVFDDVSLRWPRYALGERCPTLTCSRRASSA